VKKILLNTNNMKKETGISNGDLIISEYGDDQVKKLEKSAKEIEMEIDQLKKKLKQIRSFEIEGDEDEVGQLLNEKFSELKKVRDEIRALVGKLDLKK